MAQARERGPGVSPRVQEAVARGAPRQPVSAGGRRWLVVLPSVERHAVGRTVRGVQLRWVRVADSIRCGHRPPAVPRCVLRLQKLLAVVLLGVLQLPQLLRVLHVLQLLRQLHLLQLLPLGAVATAAFVIERRRGSRCGSVGRQARRVKPAGH